MAQLVEHILGKDEVSGSNPDSSSTKTRCPARDSGFLLLFPFNYLGKKPIQKPIPPLKKSKKPRFIPRLLVFAAAIFHCTILHVEKSFFAFLFFPNAI